MKSNNKNIDIVIAPGINGLGKTKGCKNSGEKIASFIGVQASKLNVNNENLDEQEKVIFEKALNFNGIFIGGDHSISYSIGKAFLKNYDNPCLIVLDAHADCMEPMKNPTHEEWLRALIQEGFPEENVILIGARNIDEKEKEFLDKSRINLFSIDEIRNNFEEIIQFIYNLSSGKSIYISIDIDVVDSEIVKATGYPEKNGLNRDEILKLIEKLKQLGEIKIVDIVEVNSESDDDNTIKLASEILGEFLI